MSIACMYVYMYVCIRMYVYVLCTAVCVVFLLETAVVLYFEVSCIICNAHVCVVVFSELMFLSVSHKNVEILSLQQRDTAGKGLGASLDAICCKSLETILFSCQLPIFICLNRTTTIQLPLTAAFGT